MNRRFAPVAALLTAICLCSFAPTVDAQGDKNARILAPLPESSRGWSVCWANGIVCSALNANRYVVVSDQGTADSKTIGFNFGAPLTGYADQSTCFSRFGRGTSRWRSFVGSLDTATGRVSYVMQHRTKSLWDEPPIYYYHGRFWSSDYRSLVIQHDAASFAGRHVDIFDTRTGVSRHLEAGKGLVRSWHWPAEADTMPWVLTVQPGMLVQVSATDGKEIPALDEADAAMLSPGLDRAIGFYKRLAYLVDFEKPLIKLPLKTAAGRSLGRTNVEWAEWSPDGKNVALLLSSGPDQCDLYVGDPAQGLDRIGAPDGYRFANGRDYALHGPPWTVTWAQSDGREVAAVLVALSGSEHSAQGYAVGVYKL